MDFSTNNIPAFTSAASFGGGSAVDTWIAPVSR